MRGAGLLVLIFLLGIAFGLEAKAQTAVPQMLVLDEDCMNAGQHYKKLTSLGIKFKIKTAASMKKRAVALTGRPTTSQLAEIAKIACILAVSDNPVATIAATPDLLVSEQSNRAPIDHDGAEKLFYHQVFGIQKNAVVAVIDTGIERDHLDLESRMWTGAGGELGYDFVNDDLDASDDNGHGTHMAGLIGAQRLNGEGIRGIMGDFSQIMPLKTQDSKGNGSISDIVNAINWAADHGADVINLSLAARGRNAAMEEAIKAALAKNIFIVAAAGNTNELIAPTNFISPVGFGVEQRGLMGVGSIDSLTLLRSAFSNFGPLVVEMTAPGSSAKAGILSTFMGKSYLGVDGTSASAAQVSGAAALTVGFLKTRGYVYSADLIEKMIEDSSIEDATLVPAFNKGRRLNLRRLGVLLMNSTVLSTTGGFDDQ